MSGKQKFYKRKNNQKQSNNVEKRKSDYKPSEAYKGKPKSSERAKFDGDVSLIQAITAISRINEEIRDHHLREYNR